MEPQNVKYHTCPRCKKQATVLVDIKDNTVFHRDEMGNIQYHCVHCSTTFSIDNKGSVVTIQLEL